MFTNILTCGQVLPLIPSKSCMHMGTCAKGRFGTRAHKGILYKRVDGLRKVKQAIHEVFCSLYVPYCLGLRPIWPLASRTSLGATAILAKRGKVVFSKSHVLVRIELFGAIVEFQNRVLTWVFRTHLCPKTPLNSASPKGVICNLNPFERSMEARPRG